LDEEESNGGRIGMLSLTRRSGQSIFIGDDIVIKVSKINKNGRYLPTVVLSIEAPKEIIIIRDELKLRSKQDAIHTEE
jgi:carbon storage regulator CsrA